MPVDFSFPPPSASPATDTPAASRNPLAATPLSAFDPAHSVYTRPPEPAAPSHPLQRTTPVQEILGRFEELLVATRGELGRSRTLVEHRLEELGAALHRDMSVLNLQLSSQNDTNTTDLFRLATQMSVLSDRVTRLEKALEPYLGAPAPTAQEACLA